MHCVNDSINQPHSTYNYYLLCTNISPTGAQVNGFSMIPIIPTSERDINISNFKILSQEFNCFGTADWYWSLIRASPNRNSATPNVPNWGVGYQPSLFAPPGAAANTPHPIYATMNDVLAMGIIRGGTVTGNQGINQCLTALPRFNLDKGYGVFLSLSCSHDSNQDLRFLFSFSILE